MVGLLLMHWLDAKATLGHARFVHCDGLAFLPVVGIFNICVTAIRSSCLPAAASSTGRPQEKPQRPVPSYSSTVPTKSTLYRDSHVTDTRYFSLPGHP